MSVILVLIAVFASTIGAISGIGGGIIIKPLMDAFSGLSIYTINFISASVVLCMSLFSCIYNLRGGNRINYRVILFLVIGSSAGGFLGNYMLRSIHSHLDIIQYGSLLLLNILVLIYTLNRHKLRTHHIHNVWYMIAIGVVLGTIASFLGIGGGPVNVMALYFFFSFPMKTATISSLFIIMLSQISSLAATFLSNTVPEFDAVLLAMMCAGGIAGAYMGRKIARRLSEQQEHNLFIILNVGLVLLGIYNISRIF